MHGLISAFSGLSVASRGRNEDLPTSSISIISHTHGRERRHERNIDKRELQEAVKYGQRERANPGRDGKPRWRFTYKGIVYITDATNRHEITSWRIADNHEGALAASASVGGTNAGLVAGHMVIVVDHSGSMRTGDVPGHRNRTAAVYDCLARNLIEPQLRVNGGAGLEVSIIHMSSEAEVVLRRYPANQDLLEYLRACMGSRAQFHGNYLPALDEAYRLMLDDRGRANKVFLVFLSDGAPSDHTYLAGPNASLSQVRRACVDRIQAMGDLLGRDRVFVGTVAFGPPDDDYQILKDMAAALPRGNFEKLGLSASRLSQAFQTLGSSFTTMRTESSSALHGQLTLRNDLAVKGPKQEYSEYSLITHGQGWDLYVDNRCTQKRRYGKLDASWVPVPYITMPIFWRDRPNIARGIALSKRPFGEGAERVVFQCSEVVSLDGGATAYCVGPRLVAKQPRYKQHVRKESFNRTSCRTQDEAKILAEMFNDELQEGPEMQIRFLPCHVYTIYAPQYGARDGYMDILVEEELEGKWTKWNNNAGEVRSSGRAHHGALSALGAIVEGSDEEEDEDEADSHSHLGTVDDVPQAFSHYTYVATEGKKLVCDLQGVWNRVDGFTLTDPVIHHVSSNKRNGATDKGREGMEQFFATHTCNALCRRLGLQGCTTATRRSNAYVLY